MNSKIKYITNPLYKNNNWKKNNNIKYIDGNIDNFTLDDFYEGMKDDVVEPKNISICSCILYYITCGFYRSSTEHYMEQPVNEVKYDQPKSDNNCRLI